MNLEKTINLKTGRSVKVIINLPPNPTCDSIVEVLIKDQNEKCYHCPIGITHPKYWKYKSLGQQEAFIMAVEFSGASTRQIKAAIEDFRRELMTAGIFNSEFDEKHSSFLRYAKNARIK